MKKLKSNMLAGLLLVIIIISSLGGSVSVQAADYPSVYEQEYIIDVNVGEKAILIYTIHPAYKNEKININIYNSAGQVVATFNEDFYNIYATPFPHIVSWDTTGQMAGEYTAIAKMSFYTYFAWHEAPTEEKSYITLKTSTPKKQTVKSVKVQNGRKLKVTWKKDVQANGYLIEYSTDKKFKKGKKSITVDKNATTKKTITKLKKGKQYYVRVCSYKNIMEDGQIEKLCGAWSKSKRSAVIK